MSNLTLCLRALALVLLVLSSVTLSSFGQLCDKDCRNRYEFIDCVGKLSVVFENADCWYCEEGEGGCESTDPPQNPCGLVSATTTVRYYDDGSTNCTCPKGQKQWWVQGTAKGKLVDTFKDSPWWQCK